MKKAQLSGSVRANVGKKDAKATRNAGMVPCVLYGTGEQTHFAVRLVDMQKIIFSPDVFQVEIDIDGTKKMAIIQDLHMHPVRDTAMHVDFLELQDDKPVKIALPVRTKGTAPGIMSGGKLRTPLRMLRMMGLPSALPEEVLIDISKLKIGDAIRVSDIKIDGVEFIEPQGAVVAAVKMARGAVAGSEEEEEETEAITETEAETEAE